MQNRLDENFNNPRFDVINPILSQAKYKVVLLDNLLNDINSGKTPNGLQYKDEGIPFLGASNINKGTVDIESAPKIDVGVHNTILKSSQVKKDDVLVTIAGTIGECAVYDFEDECNCNQAIAILRTKEEEINPFFLVEYLNSEIGQLFFNKLQHISSQPNINLSEIRRIKIVKPEKSIQQNIVRELKPHSDAVKTLIKAQSSLLERKEKIFRYFLGIKDLEIKKFDYYSLSPSEMLTRYDFDYNNPKYSIFKVIFDESKFDFVDLKSVANFHYETINPTKNPEKEYEYIDIGNIDTKFGKINSTRMLGKEMTSSRMRRIVREGYVLVSTTRPTRKAIAIVPKELDNQICSTGFAVIECNEQITTEFLFYFLRTDIAKLQFEQFCSGSGYPAINQEVDLPKIKVPFIPSKNDQNTIVYSLKKIDIKIEDLDNKIIQKTNQSANLFQNLIINYGL